MMPEIYEDDQRGLVRWGIYPENEFRMTGSKGVGQGWLFDPDFHRGDSWLLVG